jgi:hypothetical protein
MDAAPGPGTDRRWLWLAAALAALVAGAVIGGVMGRVAADRATARIERVLRGEDPGQPTVAGMGRLEVTSEPGDARVTVDGRLVGVTPVPRVDLDVGRHAVVVERQGYEPYVGAIAIVAGRAASLETFLAKAGSGQGSRARGSALVPGAEVSAVAPDRPAAVASVAADAADAGPASAPAAGAAVAPAATPPPRRPAPPPAPRRDCSGERSVCKDHCDRAGWDCSTRCQYCGSCPTSSMTWEQCNQTCSSCKQSCEQSERFCVSGCDSSYAICSR